MKILYGTSNKAKVEAMKKIIRIHNYDVKLLTIKDIGFNNEIEETGNTFEENATIKANTIKEFCKEHNVDENIIVLADDAGLCVKALNGEPGVYTGRYAGEHATQIENITKLLKNMEKFENMEDRIATFVCTLVAILPNGSKVTGRGECTGHIALKPSKLGGLTYGPVFIPKGFDKPMNDLNEEEFSNVHNHRDIAMEKILKLIQ